MANKFKSADAYADSIVKEFIKEITDYVFLFIEQDKNRMSDHLNAISDFDRVPVDSTIGKKVKEIFNLKNGEQNHTPKSKLIESYTSHTV